MTPWFKALFLFNSFGPLYLLVAASLYAQGGKWWWIGLVFFAVAIIIFLWLEGRFKRKSVLRKKVIVEASLDESIFTYLLTYLPPFMTDDFSAPSKLAPVVVFYSLMIILLFRSSTIYTNPFFILWGYKIYRVRFEDTKRAIILITRRSDLVDGDMLSLHEIQLSRLYFAE